MRKILSAVFTLLCVFALTYTSYAGPVKKPPLIQDDVQELPVSYVDGWNKLGSALQSVMDNVYDGEGNKVFALNTKMGSMQGSQAKKVYDTLNAVYNGQWDKLAEQGAEDFINKVWPLFGSYMSLHEAVKKSIEAVLANWSQDLYATQAYKDVVKVLNDAVVNQAVNKEPYLPSFYLRPGTSGYQAMKAMEDKMFSLWMNTDQDIELMKGDNPALLRYVFGKVPKSDREIFDGFLQRAVMDQKSYITTTYERVREEAMREAMRMFYEQTATELKKKQKMLFFVTGTWDDYGGKIIDAPAGAGDILAFESDVFVPYTYGSEIVRLIWQVYKADGTPVEGLYKFTRIQDGDKVHNARMRFRIDNLPVGKYYAQLSRCIRADCEDVRHYFAVGNLLNVKRIYLSLDQPGRMRLERDPFSREAGFLQVDYNGAESVTAGLVVSDADGKAVFRAENKAANTAMGGRLSFSIGNADLSEGTAYTAKVTVRSEDGQVETVSFSFTPKFYSVDLIGPSDIKAEKRTLYDFKVPQQMKAPFRVDTRKNKGEVSQSGQNLIAFTPVADGVRTLAVVVTDSEGRKAVGFKNVRVEPKPLEPVVHFDPQVFQPKTTYAPPVFQNTPAAKSTAPQPSVQSGSLSDFGYLGISRQELIVRGYRWFDAEFELILQRIGYICDDHVERLLKQARGNVTDQMAYNVGGWEASGASGLGEINALKDGLFMGIAEAHIQYISNSSYYECYLGWFRSFCSNAGLRKGEKKQMNVGKLFSNYIRKAPQIERDRERRSESACCVNNDCSY